MASSVQCCTWLDAVKAIASGLDDDTLPICPACRRQPVDYLYVGDATTRLGYLVVWCNACQQGVRISRAQAPVHAHFMTFTEPDSAFAARVPAFTEVPLMDSVE